MKRSSTRWPKTRPSFSRLISLRSGERGFLVPVPLKKGDDLTGFIYGTVSASDLVGSALANPEVHLHVTELQQKILPNQHAEDIFDNERPGVVAFSKTDLFMAGVANWSIEVTPTAAFVAQNQSRLPLIVAIAGVLLALLIGLTVQTAARSLAQNEFDSIWRQAVLNGAEYALISTDVDGTIRTFNHSAEVLLGYRADEVIDKVKPGAFHVHEEVVRRTDELNSEFNLNLKPGFETMTTKARLTNQADEREWTFVRKDGSLVAVTLSVSPLRSATGVILVTSASPSI